MKETKHLTLSQKIKSYIWHQIYYVFPKLQKFLVKYHIVWHDKARQKYHIGWVARGKTLQDVEKHLHEEWGFGNHFIAWVDSGQVLSWRKLANFDYQYHIRIFSDGEIRGHYEYTPESKPIKHFNEVDEESKIDDFKKFLGEYMTTEKYISYLVPDVHTAPESELSIDSIAQA